MCVGTTGGSGGMEWVAVLCLLSGEWLVTWGGLCEAGYVIGE